MTMNDSREHILKVAFSLFISNGYKSVTMSELESATKLTKGAFYHHFKNKEELFKEVIEKYYLSSHLNCRAENSPSLIHYINYSIECLKEKMISIREVTGGKIPDPYYLTVVLEAQKNFPALEEKIKSIFNFHINEWEKIIVKAKETGEIKSGLESSILAETFTSIGLGVIKNLILNDSVEYAISKVKLQFEQLYRLLK